MGGEALPQDRIERWAEKVRFIQIYGPAEVGICLTKIMSPSTAPEEVGRPLPNCSCWLVEPDDTDRLVPIGAAGEMIIAGPTLACGYLNDEAKTQLSFISAPTWATRMGLPFKRFYKTGDLLRYDVETLDGSYRFVGRKDAQIKLRGQRIEPGEVEYHLGQLPNVAVSMVTRPDEGCFAGELVAVMQMQHLNGERSKVRDESISLAPLQSLPIEMVREYISKILPHYMVPTVCLVVNNMPFVPSLKIDRRLVSTWLTRMDSRPSGLNMKVYGRLEPNELTANALSIKVAQLLARKTKARCFMFEGHDFAIQDAGIDSIQAISLLMSILKQYGRKISVTMLLSSKTTIRGLARLIDETEEPSLNGHGSANGDISSMQATAVDLGYDTKVLAENLFRNISVSKDERPSGPIENVFLTGATGYLGSAVLRQLLESPNIKVYALICCSTKSRGLQRIVDAATLYGWWQEEYMSRIHVWPGDLTKTSLGLGTTELERLCGDKVPRDLSIHAIVHNGAKVHYSSDYETLKAVNVISTLELLQITARATHISTLVYVSGGEKPNSNASDASSASLDHLIDASGYTQTKIVSEQLVRKCVDHAAFQKMSLRVVKPGYIIGSIHKGIANQNDFIWRLVAGCIEIAAYNRDEAERWLFIADVDRVADSVTKGVFGDSDDDPRGKYPSGHVDRVLDGLPFSELWDVVADVYGMAFEALGQDEWMSRLRDKVLERGETHLLFPLLHVLERDGGCLGEETSPMAATPGIKEVVEKNVKYLIGVGFLPIPKAKMGRGCGIVADLGEEGS